VSPERFTLPATPDEADDLASELGELATSAEWRRAAIVFARVRVQEGPGRPTAEKASSGLLSPAEYALRGIHGLRSRTTIRCYWRAWDHAITEGLAVPVSLGDEVEIPDAEWSDFYTITPDCPPFANTAPTKPVPDEQAEEHDWWERDDLGLGSCPPRASDVEAGEDLEPEPLPPGPDPEKLRVSRRRMFTEFLESMELDAATVLRNARGIDLDRGDKRRALERIGRIRKRLNDIEQAVRGEGGG
jgi:hypothetical protein